MEYVSELTVMQYLQTIIQNYLTSVEEDKVVINIDPDAEINLIDTKSQETPTIVIELVDTEAIENAVLGQALALITRYKISVMTAKNPKKTYLENKARNIQLINYVRLAFENQTENKVDWDGVEFYDFPLGDIPSMIGIISVSTYNRQFDYSTT